MSYEQLRELQQEFKRATWPHSDRALVRHLNEAADEVAMWALIQEEVDSLLSDGMGLIDSEFIEEVRRTDQEFSEQYNSFLPAFEFNPGLYYWLRINDERGRIATFYLRWTTPGMKRWDSINDDISTAYILEEMYIARDRKGLSPNPFDRVRAFSPFYGFMWRHRVKGDEVLRNNYSKPPFDLAGSQGVRGQLPTTRIKVETRTDSDHVWQFPHFKVRSTKLASALIRARINGFNEISLDFLRSLVAKDDGALIDLGFILEE